MSNYKIISEQNLLIQISSEELVNLLDQANLRSHEKEFFPHKILDKLNNYLEIFLLNPQNNLSKNQFRDLISRILQENSYNLTAELFSDLFDQFQPSPGSNANSESTLPFSKNIQEKFKKIYAPFEKSNQSIETILEKISQANYNPDQFELTEQIHQLILARKILPHQNILRPKNAFDEMTICLADDLNNIFDGLKQLAINFQNNISTCINFSNLRPKLSLIKSTQGLSSGPISFIKIFASTFDALRQNIPTDSTPVQTIILNIHHPDILEYLIFIKNFQKNTINRNFLFLIELSPVFLEALGRGDDFELINPENQQVVNYLSSKNTFDLIVSTIQENSQLGLIQNNSAIYENQISLSAIINLAEYIAIPETKSPAPESRTPQLDLESLNRDLPILEKYLQNQLNQEQKITTRITINLTGLADLLIKLKISQTSIQSLEIIENLLLSFQKNLKPETLVGVSLNSPILNLFESSRGLEIYDNLFFSKTNVDGLEISHPIALLHHNLQELSLNTTDLINQIVQNNSLQPLYQIPSEIKNLFLTSKEVHTEFHLNLQKTVQSILNGTIDKKIIFESGLDLEQTKDIIISYLLQNLGTIRYCTFESLLPTGENLNSNSEKNFLLNINKMKKRKHLQLQPALFQIKKTEEVSLPPISQQK